MMVWYFILSILGLLVGWLLARYVFPEKIGVPVIMEKIVLVEDESKKETKKSSKKATTDKEEKSKE